MPCWKTRKKANKLPPPRARLPSAQVSKMVVLWTSCGGDPQHFQLHTNVFFLMAWQNKENPIAASAVIYVCQR
jgi:hypothetical protein